MIALIDSGLGAINVLLECLKRCKQDYVCLIDNKNAPYGNKPIGRLKQLFFKNVKFILSEKDVNLLVVACNTLSSVLSPLDLEKLPVKTIKTNPPIYELSEKELNKNIIIFATKNTINNNKYVKYYLKKYKNIKYLFIKNLPKIIDEKSNNKIIIKNILKKHLLNKRYKNTKIVVLGCTHFTLIKDQIIDIMGKVKVLDSAITTANYVQKFSVKKDAFQIKIMLTKRDDNFEKTITKKILSESNSAKIDFVYV